MRGFAYDVVNAVLAAGSDECRDAIARAEALTAVRGSEDFAAISAAFKRMKNILRQAAEKGELIGIAGQAMRLFLTDPAERALHDRARTGWLRWLKAADEQSVSRGTGADCNAASAC